MHYFKKSSGAILITRFISRSLWKVLNGLAAAPPAIMFIIGVSTSTKSKSFKKFLRYWMILALVLKISLVLLFTIKSRYLYLYLVSWSLSPWISVGSMCKQAESNWTFPGAIDNSPALVLPGLPVTPMISPLLILL